MKTHVAATCGIAMTLISNVVSAADNVAAAKAPAPVPARAAEDGTVFAAYYTRLPIENDDPTTKVGSFADVVVRLDGGLNFVFARDASYLPCLVNGDKRTYVDEIIPRKGDGDAKRPDRFNRYSYVRVIENTPKQVVVHWRYMADFANVEWDGVVHELFTIRPAGEVERVVRKGTKSRRDWDDPLNRHVQTLRLTADGIKLVKDQKPALSKTDPGTIKGTPVAAALEPAPSLRFAFDDALKSAGTVTEEARTKTACSIGGHKAVWKSGVSGTALLFDGYYSRVDLLQKNVPDPRKGLTVQAWVAMGEYPFNWAPIVHQSEWEKTGYYLGVNELGQVGFMARIDGTWQKLQVSTNKFHTDIPLFQWHHVAATHDGKTMRLFLDGKEAASKPAAGTIEPAQRDLVIGLNSDKLRPTSMIRDWATWPTIFGIDGLIDEVAVHDRALAPAEIAACRNRIQLGAKSLEAPDLEPRGLPADPRVDKPTGFGARYRNLKFHEGFDNMWRSTDFADVVVDFENSLCRVVFWKGLRYSPALVTENGKWSGDQSAETTDIFKKGMPFDCPDAVGCAEHMSDAQTRHSHVRIIENTPARMVVHWRYAEIDVRYVLAKKGADGWGAWADEYYSFYPDGVVIRNVVNNIGGWQETLFYNAPGTRPEDNVEMEAFTKVNSKGQEYITSWAEAPKQWVQTPPRDPRVRERANRSPFVTMVNLKSKWRPYYIYASGYTSIFNCEVRPEFSRFPWWNHYPVSQAMSDGRSAERPDRMSHSSLVWGTPMIDSLMIGLTDRKPAELLPLAFSWASGPKLQVLSGADAKSARYRLQRRDYPLTATGGPIRVKLNASTNAPVHNLCFTVKQWGQGDQAVIEVDGKPAIARQGTFVDTDGTRSLVAFIELKRENPLEVTISGANPKQAVVQPVGKASK
jgi:Concanavalin A-like lectin/glucanases superfamily